MSVAAVGSAPIIPTGGERAEGPARTMTVDSDDAGVKAPVHATPAPGIGRTVDKTA